MREGATLPPDRKLGRYEIVAELAKGAMGTVYTARDPLLERTVALKTISISAAESEMAEYEARFYQEAKAAGGLNHPNIVTIYDVGKSGTVPFLAMEFLEGSELRQLMREGRALAVAHALEIAAQVADGLAYAHERGVIHRDIKPANIMVVRDGLVKIADFGVARMRSSERSGQDAQVVGSPRYMSPEQVLRKRAEQRSDIFSLGVVLYEMVTGAPPFTGADLNAIMFQIVNLVPPAPSTIAADTPPMLDFIVSKALAKTAEDRYQSARELASDLRKCRSEIAGPSTLAQLMPAHSAPAGGDPLAATPLFGKSYFGEHTMRQPPDDGEATTMGISREFDSLSATARLAVETGATEEFAALIRTLPKEAPDSATLYGTVVREQSSPRLIAPGNDRKPWDRTQRLIFSASVAVAAVVAVLIVLL